MSGDVAKSLRSSSPVSALCVSSKVRGRHMACKFIIHWILCICSFYFFFPFSQNFLNFPSLLYLFLISLWSFCLCDCLRCPIVNPSLPVIMHVYINTCILHKYIYLHNLFSLSFSFFPFSSSISLSSLFRRVSVSHFLNLCHLFIPSSPSQTLKAMSSQIGRSCSFHIFLPLRPQG